MTSHRELVCRVLGQGSLGGVSWGAWGGARGLGNTVRCGPLVERLKSCRSLLARRRTS